MTAPWILLSLAAVPSCAPPPPVDWTAYTPNPDKVESQLRELFPVGTTPEAVVERGRRVGLYCRDIFATDDPNLSGMKCTSNKGPGPGCGPFYYATWDVHFAFDQKDGLIGLGANTNEF